MTSDHLGPNNQRDKQGESRNLLGQNMTRLKELLSEHAGCVWSFSALNREQVHQMGSAYIDTLGSSGTANIYLLNAVYVQEGLTNYFSQSTFCIVGSGENATILGVLRTLPSREEIKSMAAREELMEQIRNNTAPEATPADYIEVNFVLGTGLAPDTKIEFE